MTPINRSFMEAEKAKRAQVGNLHKGEIVVMADFALNADALRYTVTMSTAHPELEWFCVTTKGDQRRFQLGKEVI